MEDLCWWLGFRYAFKVAMRTLEKHDRENAHRTPGLVCRGIIRMLSVKTGLDPVPALLFTYVFVI
jgi:hypothetical protein